jgi:hypothetical protein
VLKSSCCPSAPTLGLIRSSQIDNCGTNSTATNHEMISEIAVTAKIEKVYSPASDLASAIGRKPAAVISLPVGIGIAVSSYIAVAAARRSAPSSILRTTISTAMIASSTSRPKAMISAPSEILCRPMPVTYIARKVSASTSGIVSATTSPGRMSTRSGLVCRPRLTKETASTIATASISTRMNSLTLAATARGWSATLNISMPTGNCDCKRRSMAARSRPSAMMSPPLAIDTPKPMTSRAGAPPSAARILSRGGSM